MNMVIELSKQPHHSEAVNIVIEETEGPECKELQEEEKSSQT